MSAAARPRPFAIHVGDDVLAGLRERPAGTRWPDEAPESGWRHGADLAYGPFCACWGERHDWRAPEVRLSAFRQLTVPLTGIDVHFILPAADVRAFFRPLR